MKEYLTYDDVNILPKYSEVLSRKNVDISSDLFLGYKLSLPIISAPMDTVTGEVMASTMIEHGGVGCVHRFCSIDDQVAMAKSITTYAQNSHDTYESIKAPEKSVFSIGVTGDFRERFQALYLAGVRNFCLDIAHGDHILTQKAIYTIRSERSGVMVIAGNIATPGAAVRLTSWGANCLRVGIGGGSVCSTRTKTGVGVPMISCIQSIYEELQNKKIETPIMCDGGLRTPGDICKAIAAGASTVMLGSMLAGTKQSPGDIIWRTSGAGFKLYRGSASEDAKTDRDENNFIEGVSEKIPYKGCVNHVLKDIEDSLRSSFSYVGANNIEEFRTNAELIKVSNAGAYEGKPHILGN